MLFRSRLLGAILIEQNDEWLVGKRYFSEASMAKLHQPDKEAGPLTLPTAS